MFLENASTYNGLYENLTENNVLYCKQFGFQKEHSPEHAFLQFVEQTNQSFQMNEFTLSMFVNLSKAFNTVDHQILPLWSYSYSI